MASVKSCNDEKLYTLHGQSVESLLENVGVQRIVGAFSKYGGYLYGSAKDARQEAYLCLLRAFDTFKPKYKNSFQSWFYWITHNKFETERRNQSRNKLKEVNCVLDKIVERANDNYTYEYLRNLSFLNHNERDLIYQRFWENKTLLEIATSFGVTKQCIKRKLDSTLLKIRRHISN